MFYRFLADSVVLLHFAFVMFAVFGGLLTLRWWRVAWLHLPVALWAALVEMYFHYCPLTPLENRLRELGRLEAYQGGFIAHYILPVIYPPGITPAIQFILGILLVAAYSVVYTIAWKRHTRSTKEMWG